MPRKACCQLVAAVCVSVILWLSNQHPLRKAHLFIRDPLRLVQGEGAVEGAVFGHHAEAAGAADQFLSVGD